MNCAPDSIVIWDIDALTLTTLMDHGTGAGVLEVLGILADSI